MSLKKETGASIEDVSGVSSSTVTACRSGFEYACFCILRLLAWIADLLIVSFLASKSSSSRIYEGSEWRVEMGEVGNGSCGLNFTVGLQVGRIEMKANKGGNCYMVGLVLVLTESAAT